MPKKILEDIKPLTRTKRAGAPKKTRASKENEESLVNEDMDLKITSYDSNVSFERVHSPKRLSITLWVITIAALGFLFFILSSIFSKATIEIKPKKASGSLDTTFVAKKDSAEELSFQIMSISDEVSEKVKSTSKEKIENKAKGTVIVYNEFSTSKQNLLIDTRLVASDGKIYKTEKAFTVPGYTKKGTEIIPGSVEVDIYADVAGADYNKENADLKIFGFKGSPKYEKFYARTKSKITGGFSGERYTIDEEKAEEIAGNLETAIIEKLKNEILTQIPTGYIMFGNSVQYEIDSIDPTSVFGETEEFEIIQKGSAVAYIFEEYELASSIAEFLTSQYDGSTVRISDISNTEMILDGGNANDSKSIRFKLKGEPTITWVVDEEAIKNSLIGISVKKFNETLAGFSGVDTGKVTIRPLWKKTFPKDSSKIEIVILD